MVAMPDQQDALEAVEVLRQFIDRQIGASDHSDGHQEPERFLALSQEHLSLRALRQQVLGPDLASETCWDILLLVYLAKRRNINICLKDIKSETNIPVTTIIRWVGALEASGMIFRKRDSTDARRHWLYMEERAVALVEGFFARQVKGDHLRFFAPFSKKRRKN